ncbi:PepSY domain-containing protein [Solwaraspora sp. WMMD791]|uniref:PepSY domain-containing protein n=1 Tax=Solwaraspora sp. WMMD791 TaxID=3016086 RepID=UPI00249CA2AB|nr:PepSY domain-containing protein [Solwaraspora sp. WMMD791]WFE29361.1 PepSY domain-containing protein [Solwaraspora sp. WMMD791]
MARRSVIVMAGVGAVAALAVAGTAVGSAAQNVTGTAKAVSATSGTGPATASQPATTGTPTAPATGSGDAGATDVVGVEQAKRIALAHVGEGRVTEIERDQEHGRPVWEVEVRAERVEWDLDIDRETGGILDVDRDDDDDDDGRDDDGHDDDRRDRDDDHDDDRDDRRDD